MEPKSDKLLILDMDETLIHAVESKEPLSGCRTFRAYDYHVRERPGAREFLQNCFELFEVAVWTSASRRIAFHIMDEILPKGADLSFLWGRERCTIYRNPETMEYLWLKNITKLRKKGRDITKIIAVDDSSEKWVKSYGNLVRVKPFMGDPKDDELFRLFPYLQWLAGQPNVRTIEKRGWSQNDVLLKMG